MQKIPTLFIRDTHNPSRVTGMIPAELEWVRAEHEALRQIELVAREIRLSPLDPKILHYEINPTAMTRLCCALARYSQITTGPQANPNVTRFG